jgi:pimeloyl-ACP methyl ester carboxylesterase
MSVRRVRHFLILFTMTVAAAACSSSGSSSGARSGTDGSSTTAASSTTLPPLISAPTRTEYLVKGRAVSMVCKGRGRVPVVFQAGGDDPGTVWDGLVTALGPNVLTCVFDRPGVSPSAPSPTLLTPRSVANTLAATLAQAHVGPRVILVGHSLGGINVLVFGADHPDQVAGAVLFDPSEADFSESIHGDSLIAGYGYAPQAEYAQIRAVTRWPNVPLVVLSRDPAKAVADNQDTAAQEQIWVAGARKYAALSREGTRVVVPGASHYVYLDAPKVAAGAIRTVLAHVAPARS